MMWGPHVSFLHCYFCFCLRMVVLVTDRWWLYKIYLINCISMKSSETQQARHFIIRRCHHWAYVHNYIDRINEDSAVSALLIVSARRVTSQKSKTTTCAWRTEISASFDAIEWHCWHCCWHCWYCCCWQWRKSNISSVCLSGGKNVGTIEDQRETWLLWIYLNICKNVYRAAIKQAPLNIFHLIRLWSHILSPYHSDYVLT